MSSASFPSARSIAQLDLERKMKTDRSSHSSTYVVYIVVLLTLTNILSYADRHLFSILVPAIKETFGASDGILGLLGGPAFITTYLFFCLPLAQLADRVSRRKVLSFSILLWSGATAFCGVATSIGQLALGRLGVGMGEAGGSPAAQSLISTVVSPRFRSTAMGVFTTGGYIGLGVGLWGGGALAELFGWQHTMILLGIPGIILSLLVWFTVPRRKAALHSDAPMPLRSVLRHCWRVPSIRLILLGLGTMNFFGYSSAVWSPSYLVRSHGLSMMEVGFWSGILSAPAGLAGAVIAGLLADRMTRRSPRFQMWIPAAGFLLALPLFVAQFLWPAQWTVRVGDHTLPLVVFFSAPASLLMGFWLPTTTAAIQNLVPVQIRAQAAALAFVVMYVGGGMLGPSVVGMMSDAFVPQFGVESLRLSLLFSTVFLLVGGVFLIRAAKHYGADLQKADSTEKYS